MAKGNPFAKFAAGNAAPGGKDIGGKKMIRGGGKKGCRSFGK